MKKKVLLLTCTYLPTLAGTEIEIYNIAKRLKKRGYDIRLALPSWYAKRQFDNNNGIKIIQYSSKIISLWAKLFKFFDISILGRVILQNILKSFDADIIITFFSFPTSVFFQTHKFKNKKIIIVPQGADVQVYSSVNYGLSKNKKIRKAIKKTILNADSTLYMGDAMKKSIQYIVGEDISLSYVPTATDTNRISKHQVDRTKILEKYKLDKDTVILLTVGRNHPKKGYDLIPDIFRSLNKKLPNKKITWIIIGKDCEMLDYNLNSKNKIFSIKPIPLEKNDLSTPPAKLIDFYKIADLYCSPTRVEGLSLVFLDVLASGTPIVSTKTDGVKDLLKDEHTGLLSKVEDVEEMAKNLSILINDKKKYDYISKQSIQLSKIYDWSKVINKYEDIINSV